MEEINPFKIPTLTIGPNLYQKFDKKFLNTLFARWKSLEKKNFLVEYIGNDLSRGFTILAAAKEYYKDHPREYRQLNVISPISFLNCEYAFNFDFKHPSHKMGFRKSANNTEKSSSSSTDYKTKFENSVLNYKNKIDKGRMVLENLENKRSRSSDNNDNNDSGNNLNRERIRIKLAEEAQILRQKFINLLQNTNKNNKSLELKEKRNIGSGGNDDDDDDDGSDIDNHDDDDDDNDDNNNIFDDYRIEIDIPFLIEDYNEFINWSKIIDGDILNLAAYVCFSNSDIYF